MPSVVAAQVADQGSVGEDVVLRKIFRRVISFLVILFIISFLDRINIAFAALSMNKHLGLTAVQFGVASSVFYAGYVLCEIPSNMMMARYGARKWISRIMITFGLASAATMFATGPNSLYVLRIITGVAEAGFMPGILLYLTFWFPPSYRARATALFLIAAPFTIAIAAPVSGFILDHTHELLGLHGWQWLFVLEGLPAVIMGIVTYFYLSDGPEGARWLTDSEKAALQARMEREQATAVGPVAKGGKFGHYELWREVLGVDSILLGVIYFGVTTSMMANATWTPQIIREMMSTNTFSYVGLLVTIPSVCAVIAMPLWGARSDRKMERRWHVALPSLLAAVGWILVSCLTDPAIRMIGLIFCVAGAYSAQTIFWTIPPHVLSPKARPIGIAFINTCGLISSATCPAIIGFLRDLTHSWVAGLTFVSALLVVSAVLLFVLPGMRNERRASGPAAESQG